MTTTLSPTSPDASVRAVVDLDVAGPTISRHLYGHFAEHLGRCIYDGFWVGEDSDIPNEGGIRLDVVEALRALRIPVLRWPGGCFADEYHWSDGIGPRDQRPRMVNTHWGNVEENNHFGTHEFMALCDLLGTEPYVSANIGSGSVQEMSEWVEYLTRAGDSPMARLRRENGRDEPWRVPFWGVGNEPWGCGGNLRAEQFAPLARQYATYARNHGDNALYKIAAGASDDDYHWTETLMKEISTLGAKDPHLVFQAVSFHAYTFSGTWGAKGRATEFSEDEYYETMRRTLRVGDYIAGHAAVMDAYDPEKKVGLVLDEWGTWWDVEPGTNPGFLFQQNAMRDAIVASLHFDMFHAHADRLVMANIAQTVNVLQAMLLTDGEALVLTPTYHVFEMNAGHQDATSHAAHLTSAVPTREVDGQAVPLVSLSASSKDGAVLVSLTNLDADAAHTVELDLRGRAVHEAQGRVLVADALTAHNTPDLPDAVAPVALEGVTLTGGVLRVELPAASFATVSLQAADA
ncbi:alpha-N-arabinofuranosidase [Oerskovia flava]|uniref:alpha-N-arabinofuranosidase n=1 Tax=Oerskovia flava TaxID=2986422 RepID=UPI002240B221|nr:alpha-L-arabinofuranosidase C-terminal domain-containing protein [Oerskovia sp. JB1-3-2]